MGVTANALSWQTDSDHMKKAAKFASGLGCLVSVIAPLLAILFYPRANWLFAFMLIGVAVVAFNALWAKDPTPQDLADEIERLLTGHYGGWDVDNFEHRRIRNPQLKEFWHRSMEIGGLPEEWVRLDEGRKRQMQEVIQSLRELSKAQDAGASPRTISGTER
jgi:hypothetical protein